MYIYKSKTLPLKEIHSNYSPNKTDQTPLPLHLGLRDYNYNYKKVLVVRTHTPSPPLKDLPPTPSIHHFRTYRSISTYLLIIAPASNPIPLNKRTPT